MYKECKVTAVVATDLNGVIGVGNRLPWHCKADLNHFRKLTTGKVCIMGRKTFESLPKPLTKRQVVVLSSNPSEELIDQIFDLDNHTIAQDVETALAIAHSLAKGGEIMICGGATIYKAFLSFTDEARISKINTTVVKPATDEPLVKLGFEFPPLTHVFYTFFNLE